MNNDFEYLWKLNIEIGLAESGGQKGFFEKNLAPAFAIRRGNPAREAVDRKAFVDGVKGSSRRDTEIESISFFGKERAIVTCVVTMDGNRYHNIRLWVRQPRQDWKLIGWANELVV